MNKGACSWLVVLLIVLVSSMMGLGVQTLAQSGDGIWNAPANLSRSRAASAPTVVTQPGGRLRVFWWDRFDGVTMAEGTLAGWSEPVPAPIFIVTRLERPTPEGETTLTTEVDVMPTIVGDATGQAHAFWLGEADEETGARPLLYARMSPASTAWSTAATVAESATGFDAAADATGVLHLAYLRDIQAANFPIGIYYRRSVNGGANWGASLALDASRYYRLLSDAEVYLQLGADSAGSVYLTWDAPHLAHVLLAGSSDGGVTWSQPVPVGGGADGVDAPSQRGRVVPVPGGETLLLWKRPRGLTMCDSYQAPVSALLSGVTEGTRQVLAERTACEWEEQFLSLGERRVLLAADGGDGYLDLATWNGEGWQGARTLSLVLDTPASGGRIRLSDVQLALTSTPASDEEPAGGQAMVAVGIDQNSEVWIAGSRMEVLEPYLAPLPPTPTPTPRIRLPDPSAGSVELEPAQPINLSRSGAASSPTVLSRADGAISAFWWDQFDGLYTAEGLILPQSVVSGTQTISFTIEPWSDPVPVPIVWRQTVERESEEDGSIEVETVLTPTQVMPTLWGAPSGQTHAFWLEGADADTVDQPLMHSILNADHTTWTQVEVLVESAVAYDVVVEGDGLLHLVYLRTQYTEDVPSGVYYRRSDDGGKTWGQLQFVHKSRYYRLLSLENAHLRLAAGAAGDVYVTWDDPRRDQVWLAGSADGGATWSEPVPAGDPDVGSRYGRLFALSGQDEDQVWLLWEGAGYGGQCVLYQAPARELLLGAEGAGRRVLEGLTACPAPGSEQFLPLAGGSVLLVAGGDSDVLTLAVWDPAAESETGRGQWSEPRQQSFQFEDPETGVPVYLRDLQAAVVEVADPAASPAGQGTGQALIVVGSDGEGDVWVTPSRMGALEVVFAPPSPWSAPVNVSQSDLLPGLPALATDAEGRVHALWAESDAPGEPGEALSYASWDSAADPAAGGGEWMRPVPVLQSPEGGAEEPALAVLGDRIHALWSGGPSGQVWYSRAFLRDAYAASAWDDPRPLPTPEAGSQAGSRPHIVAAAEGILHAVYAVPVNEDRGIYYTRSADEGETWSPLQQVFDAAQAGWAAVDGPRVAVDGQGRLHVVWMRTALSAENLSQGVYYAWSDDGGETWSAPLQVVEGAYDWPQVVADGAGRVHLLWHEAAGGDVWWHRWFANEASEPTVARANWEGWTQPDQVPGFRDVPGPVGVAADGGGVLHLVGLGRDMGGAPELLYMTWGDPAAAAASVVADGWGEQQAFRLEVEPEDAGLALSLQPARQRLDVLFHSEVETAEGTVQSDLWHTGRAITITLDLEGQAGTALPTPTVDPDLAASPAPTPTPEATPSPTPNLNVIPPLSGEGDGGLPLVLMLSAGVAAVVVAGVFGLYLLVFKRR